MKTGDEKTIIAYAARDFIADSIDDIIDGIATVVPKVFYHIIIPDEKPTGRQIADYQCKQRIKPGKKT